MRADSNSNVPVTLQIGAVTDAVAVEANAELVETRSGTLSSVVGQQRIVELPLNGRNAATLVLLSPGTTDLKDFTQITQNVSGANSIYNSLQMSVDKRFSHGFTLDANYTWGHSLDWVSYLTDPDGINAINPTNLKAYRGSSDFNVPHRFIMNYVWQLPSPREGVLRHVLGGWESSGICAEDLFLGDWTGSCQAGWLGPASRSLTRQRRCGVRGGCGTRAERYKA